MTVEEAIQVFRDLHPKVGFQSLTFFAKGSVMATFLHGNRTYESIMDMEREAEALKTVATIANETPKT